MSDGILASTTVPILEQVINFAQSRHGVLVGNVANLDTPGYKTRDLSIEMFHERLKEAIELRKERDEHISPGILTQDQLDPLLDVSDSMKSILYHDDSNVDIEQQVLEISKNQFMHNMAISIMSSQFRLLNTAISERV